MEQHNHEHTHPEEHRSTDWRSYRGRGGRVLSGLLLAGVGGFWLTTNVTDHAALIADNPGRVVFPALAILLGIVTIVTKRGPRANVEQIWGDWRTEVRD